MAIGEGEPNSRDQACIYLLHIDMGVTVEEPMYAFQKGVQHIAFSNDAKLLFALSVIEEGCLIIMNLETKTIERSVPV